MPESEVVEVPVDLIDVSSEDDDVVVINEVTVIETVEVGLTGPQGPIGPNGTVVRERPTGAIDGANVMFATTHDFVLGTTQLYLNGLLQSEGDDYTESGTTAVEFTDAPWDGDTVLIVYLTEGA